VRKKAVFIAGLAALCFFKGAVLEAVSMDVLPPWNSRQASKNCLHPA